MRKLYIVLLTLALVLTGLAFTDTDRVANAESLVLEGKSFCNATIDDDFADDRVLVTLNK